jgi:hypothetical protein
MRFQLDLPSFVDTDKFVRWLGCGQYGAVAQVTDCKRRLDIALKFARLQYKSQTDSLDKEYRISREIRKMITPESER